MPTQTGPLYPAYATPRFCVDHAIRDAGVGAVALTVSTTAGFPLDRILDNQIGLVWRQTTPNTGELKLDRGLTRAKQGFSIDRVVILGSNFGAQATPHRIDVRSSFSVSSGYSFLNQVVGGVEYDPARYDLPPRVIDWELDLRDEHQFFKIDWFNSATDDVEIGELWFTRTLQPTAGIAHRWTNGILPAVTASETSAHIVTHNIDGDERARFAISWDLIPNGPDLELLRYVKRKAGIRRNVLLYEHADFGTDPTVIDSFDDHTGYTLVNLTASDSPTGAPGGNDDAVDFTSVAGGATNIEVYDDAANPIDMTDAVLEYWFFMDDAATVAAHETTAALTVQSTTPTSTTNYNIDTMIQINSSAGHWYKVSIDLELHLDVAHNPGGPVDLRRVTALRIVGNASAAGDVIRYSKFYMRRKRQYPVPCYLTGYEEVQAGRQPSGGAGPLYRVSMTLEEALA